MNKKQIAKLNMYLAVQQTLASNKGVYEKFSRLNEEVSKFNELVDKIDELNTSLSKGTGGVTKGNANTKQNMIDSVVKLARVALVWAKDNKNADLMALFDIHKTDFVGNDADRYAKANKIMNEIGLIENDLGKLNVAPEDITKAKALVKAYKDTLGTTQSAVKANKSMNAEIENLFKDVDECLVNIGDLSVNAMNEPAFANAFVATKVINDAAVRRTGVTIAVTDSESQEPITTAWAYIEGSEKKDDADQEGLCELYKLRPGTYTIRIEAPGYKTEKLTATVEQGRITETEIGLSKA
jgi:hypothetical protein